MYDFHYGSKDQIKQDPEEFLIFVKRLLPRWINGIPDSECLAIYRTLVSMNKKDSTLIETGCGASTLAMFLYAVLNDAHIFSWDTNGICEQWEGRETSSGRARAQVDFYLRQPAPQPDGS